MTEGDVDIVIGLDDRPESRVALEVATQEARLRGGRLHLVHLLAASSDNPQRARSVAADAERWHREGQRIADDLVSSGLEATYTAMPAESGPGQRLLDVARQLHAELIVIGIRRRSPVGKLVLGSVSQEVLLGADCPVLAVKADE